LAAAPDGSVWAVVNRNQVRRFGGGGVRDYPLAGRASYLLLDRERRLWAIGERVWRTAGDVTAGNVRFERLDPLATDGNEDFTQASMDAGGRVYLAGTNGLAIYDPATGGWQRLGTKDGLASLRLLGVLADSSGRVWVSYRQAIPPTRLVAVNGRWEVDRMSFPAELGRTLQVGFAEDRQKRVWVSTEAGVFVWNESHWRQYRREDGLRSEDSVAGAIVAPADGTVWVGTTRGLACFDNDQPAMAPVPPPSAVVAGLTVEGRDVAFGLRSLSYWREAEQLYLYRLQGRRFWGSVFDSGWQETREPGVRYANLPGGRYRVEVKARNAEQVWSQANGVREFEVAIPWYASGWLGGSMVVGVPGLSYLAMRVYRRRRAREEQRRRDQLERELERRTAELAEARQRAERSSGHLTELLATMSEQVRGPMHAFMGLTQLALTAGDEARRSEYLLAAQGESEALVATLGDLLDYAESESGRLVLHPAACDLPSCVRGVAERAGPIRWEMGSDVPRWVRVDPRRLRQVLWALVEQSREGEDEEVRLAVEASPAGVAQALVTFTVMGGQPRRATALGRGGASEYRVALRVALAARLVDVMGGRLAPVPEAAGVAFSLTVPVLASEAEPWRRVLVLDAEGAPRRAVCGALENAGITVTAAAAVAAVAEGEPFEVIVVGRAEWASQVRQREKAAGRGPARLVLLAADGMARPAEADVVVAVPVDPDTLLRAVAPAAGAHVLSGGAGAGTWPKLH